MNSTLTSSANVLLCCLLLAADPPAIAQVVPDNTLPIKSRLNRQGNTLRLDGGTERGANLFHSFKQFSVPTNNTVYFNNSQNVQNIFSRVTGGSVSNINGLLKTNGTANLFLLNPNGIIFGPNSALNIGGSFLGTSASSIEFLDGAKFRADNPESSPLLSISAPNGLVFKRNSGGIAVQGEGNQLSFANPNSPVQGPIIGTGESKSGLRTPPGKTLSLVGGQVVLDGGILTAPSGKVEVGSVAEGTVGLKLNPLGFSFNYGNVLSFKDVNLNKQALIDASGIFNGQINVHTRNISLKDSSIIIISNFGDEKLGGINIDASGSLTSNGLTDTTDFNILSDVNNKVPGGGILSQNFLAGIGAPINVSTSNLTIADFTSINSLNYGEGFGGDIGVALRGALHILGAPPVQFLFLPTTISTITYNDGDAGNIKLSGTSLVIQNGGLILSQTFGKGEGGDIKADFTNNINVLGSFLTDPSSNSFIPSTLGTLTVASGNAGNVEVSTSRTRIEGGGRINATTAGSGRAGEIVINSTELVEVIGKVPNSDGNELFNLSQIVSSATKNNFFLSQLFDIPSVPSGESGNIIVNTGQITVKDGAQVSVINEGINRAGEINVISPLLIVDSIARITGETASGEGGNILLRSQNIQLRRNSAVTTTAGGSEKGGNIMIDSDLLVVIEGSDITANALKGPGGKVEVTTQGLFRTPDSQITATGGTPQLSGVVEINSPDIDLSRTAAQPSEQPQTPQVSTVCQSRAASLGSSLINTGTGGTPASAKDSLSSSIGWYDSSIPQPGNRVKKSEGAVARPRQIIEAQGWRKNADGTMSMVVEAEGVTPYSSLESPPCQSKNSKL